MQQVKSEFAENVLTVQGDVTNCEALQNLYKTVSSHFGSIDIVVANAGVVKRVDIRDASEDDFDHMVNTNYRGLFFTVKHAIKYLREGASIILISSGAAHVTMKSHSIYSSTKSAVVKLAKNLAYDLSDMKIRVNSISPGYIETPIFDKLRGNNPNYLKEREAYIPLKRIGTPQDIASAALFLGSDEASYITGADLVVDGGCSASFPVTAK